MNPKSKALSEHGKTFARGGKGGANKMFGDADRVRTATADAAGPQTKAQTASKSKTNPKYAKGGKASTSVGGLALPAIGGRTAPSTKRG